MIALARRAAARRRADLQLVQAWPGGKPPGNARGPSPTSTAIDWRSRQARYSVARGAALSELPRQPRFVPPYQSRITRSHASRLFGGLRRARKSVSYTHLTLPTK